MAETEKNKGTCLKCSSFRSFSFLPSGDAAVIYLATGTLTALLTGQLDAAGARSSGQLAIEGGSTAARHSAIEVLTRVMHAAQQLPASEV